MRLRLPLPPSTCSRSHLFIFLLYPLYSSLGSSSSYFSSLSTSSLRPYTPISSTSFYTIPHPFLFSHPFLSLSFSFSSSYFRFLLCHFIPPLSSSTSPHNLPTAPSLALHLPSFPLLPPYLLTVATASVEPYARIPLSSA